MYFDVRSFRARPSAGTERAGGVRHATPSYGRFLQADPIGYGDGMNMYGYVSGDPVNGSDPSGNSRIDYYRLRMAKDGGATGSAAREQLNRSFFGGTLAAAGYTWQKEAPGSVSTVPVGPGENIDGVEITAGKYKLVGGFGLGFLAQGVSMNGRHSRVKAPATPAYCRSTGYQVGEFIDETVGGTLKDIGGVAVVGGLAVGAATAITGVGAGAGGAIAGAGGAAYAGGTAVSTIGNGIKWISGQDAGPTAAGLLSVPTMALGPVAQIVTDKIIGAVTDKVVKDPCHE